jgi:hypothetical protein
MTLGHGPSLITQAFVRVCPSHLLVGQLRIGLACRGDSP